MNQTLIPLIRPTCDRKTRFYPTQKNTYGLLPGPRYTCKHATTEEGGCWSYSKTKKYHLCYVDQLLNIYKNVYTTLAHNTYILMHATEKEMIQIIDYEIQRFKQAEYRRFKRKNEGPFLFYRFHWSGDIFSEEYAKAIATVVKNHPDVTFWNYTRNFEYIPILIGIKNLTQYLSLDPVNFNEGMRVYKTYYSQNNNLQISYMSKENTFREKLTQFLQEHNIDKNNLPEWAVAASFISACPVDIGRLPLESGCAICKKCIATDYAKSRPIWFKV